MSELVRRVILGALCALACSAPALAQSNIIAGQAKATSQTPQTGEAPNGEETVGGWPKIGFDTVASLEVARMNAPGGLGRGPDANLRMDSTFLAEFNDTLSLDGLFQVKSRSPFDPNDANKDLFINQGAGRKEGIKTKELYIRYGDYRFGKFVQDFGRAYAYLASPAAADFVEEPEEGYEPADMIGVERLHVFDDETEGWRQLSVSAFMVDRTFLHQSWPYNEGYIHLRDGGVGNTAWPENVMVTWDNLNQPVGHWGHLTWQASVIRWGRTYSGTAGEFWSTLGGDLAIPLHGSVADTLRGHYTQLHLYVEAARRDNFGGVNGRARTFLSGDIQYMDGPFTLDLTNTQRWTSGANMPSQTDQLYTVSTGYTLPSQTVIALSVAQEKVADRKGVFAGIRFTQTLTTCSRCIARGHYY